MRGPEFFIVGAPKCGTTALTAYLAQHPEIGMCARKETQHFATDMRERLAVKSGSRRLSEQEYLDLFAPVQDRRLLGEASVWYLYSRAAPHEIHRFMPEARIIAMFRSPVEMLPSLHSEFVYVGLEPEEDFTGALALDARREREGTPQGFPPHSYRAAVRYAEQLRRYFDAFGRERVHVIIYDDFRADTAAAYRRTCEFLGVDPEFEPEIEVVNPNKEVRSSMLRGLLRRPPEPARRVLHRITSQRARVAVGQAIKRWNTRFAPRTPVADAGVKAELRRIAEGEGRKLGKLIGRDLSAWWAAG